MSLVRSTYIFLASALPLNVVAWSAISLLRSLTAGEESPQEALAFQLAVVVIGLPIYLAHWRWAEFGNRPVPWAC